MSPQRRAWRVVNDILNFVVVTSLSYRHQSKTTNHSIFDRQIFFLILLSVCWLSFPTSTKRSLPNLHKGLSLSPKLIRRSTNCHCPPPKKYKLQFRLFLPSSSLHLLLVVALQGAVTWHYDHFFPFNLAKTKQRENLNLAHEVLKDCHRNGQKLRFPKIAENMTVVITPWTSYVVLLHISICSSNNPELVIWTNQMHHIICPDFFVQTVPSCIFFLRSLQIISHGDWWSNWLTCFSIEKGIIFKTYLITRCYVFVTPDFTAIEVNWYIRIQNSLTLETYWMVKSNRRKM